MEFRLSPEQRALQETARRYARAEMPDLALVIEADDIPVPKKVRRDYGRMGFLGVNLPPEYGGLGLGHIEALLVLEEFAQVSPAVAWPIFESVTGPAQAILRFGSEELKSAILPRVVAGDFVIAASMSEPDAGTALTDLRARGRFEGDQIILTGQKRWCSGGGHADAYLVCARLSAEPGAKGIGAVLVENGRDGLSFGKPERLMGFRGIPSADLYLDEVRVPFTNLLAPAGSFGKLMEAFGLERCGNATMSLAIAAAALEEVVNYTQQRKQFGKAIAEFQAVQLKLADMAIRVEAARLLIHRAAQGEAGHFPSQYESSVAKCYANEIVKEVAGMGLQLMGANGYSKAYRMEQRVRDSYAWGIAGGTIDIQKINIASSLLGRRFDQRR